MTKQKEPDLRLDGFPKRGSVVLIDFDGTMALYRSYKEHKENPGKVLSGVRETIKRLQYEGYKVLIWTARDDKAPVKRWLTKNKVTVDGFYQYPKPLNLALILDDRALRATGSPLDPEEVFLHCKPWWKSL